MQHGNLLFKRHTLDDGLDLGFMIQQTRVVVLCLDRAECTLNSN